MGAQVGAAAESDAASTGDVGIDPNAVYSLGRSSGESERLQRQADELASEREALLDRVELGPGESALDLGLITVPEPEKVEPCEAAEDYSVDSDHQV